MAAARKRHWDRARGTSRFDRALPGRGLVPARFRPGENAGRVRGRPYQVQEDKGIDVRLKEREHPIHSWPVRRIPDHEPVQNDNSRGMRVYYGVDRTRRISLAHLACAARQLTLCCSGKRLFATGEDKCASRCIPENKPPRHRPRAAAHRCIPRACGRAAPALGLRCPSWTL